MNDVKVTDLSLRPPGANAPGGSVAGSASSASTPSSVTTSPAEGAPVKVTEPTPQAAQVQQQADAQEAELREAVTRLNDYVQSVQRDLQFELDDTSGKTIITVLDRSTQEVVRQIPDEVALKLARNLQNEEPVSLFNAKA